MKIILIGGTKFIGYHLLRELGYKEHSSTEENLKETINYIQKSIPENKNRNGLK